MHQDSSSDQSTSAEVELPTVISLSSYQAELNKTFLRKLRGSANSQAIENETNEDLKLKEPTTTE